MYMVSRVLKILVHYAVAPFQGQLRNEADAGQNRPIMLLV